MSDTPKPNKRVIKRWVEALRSGKYKQGAGQLRTGDSFCCLGVLCDLHSRTKDGSKWEGMNEPPNVLEFPVYLGEGAQLPSPVAVWAGLPSCNPSVEIRGKSHRLSHFNDNGKRFDTLANAIEREFLGGGK